MRTRKIGLGVMGVHDAMLMAGLPYDSPEGRAWCEEVMRADHRGGRGRVPPARGVARAVPGHGGEHLAGVPGAERRDDDGRAHRDDLPARRLLERDRAGLLVRLHPEEHGRKDVRDREPGLPGRARPDARGDGALRRTSARQRAEEVVSHVHETGTVQDLAWLPEGFRTLFKTALDISWQDHVRMQASFQKHVHASISKTVNMPCSATKEDCAEALLMAWRLGLKGITLYRTREPRVGRPRAEGEGGAARAGEEPGRSRFRGSRSTGRRSSPAGRISASPGAAACT